MTLLPVDIAGMAARSGVVITLTRGDGLRVLNEIALKHSSHIARCWRAIGVRHRGDERKLLGVSGPVVLDGSFLDGAGDRVQRVVERILDHPMVLILNPIGPPEDRKP